MNRSSTSSRQTPPAVEIERSTASAPTRRSGVAFTNDAQKYGYCYDDGDASGCAERFCAQGSGQTCQTLFRADEPGYYALALGTLGWGVGYSPSNAEDAGQSAMNQCNQQTQGCRVVETWQATGKNK